MERSGAPYRVADKSGRGYLVGVRANEDRFTRLDVSRIGWFGRRQPVGYVNLVWMDAGVVLLGDLHLGPLARGRGLGTAVLQLVISLAKQRGAARLVGKLVAKDVRETPHLVDWYRKRGFTVEEVNLAEAVQPPTAPRSESLARVRRERSGERADVDDTRTVAHVALQMRDESA